jgi:hypothetical protein
MESMAGMSEAYSKERLLAKAQSEGKGVHRPEF